MATPRVWGRLPFQRFRPALPTLMSSASALPTTPRVARQSMDTRRISKRVSGDVDRPARDATLDLSTGQINPTPSATGLTVRAAALRKQLKHSLLSVGASRDVKVKTNRHQVFGHTSVVIEGIEPSSA